MAQQTGWARENGWLLAGLPAAYPNWKGSKINMTLSPNWEGVLL
jgi:hypothetical protein